MIDIGTKETRIVGPVKISREMTVKFVQPTNPMPPKTKSIAGTIKDRSKLPAQRRVYAFRRSTGQLIGEVLSDPTTGQYQIDVPNEEIIVVALDDDASPLLNDLINRVLPE